MGIIILPKIILPDNSLSLRSLCSFAVKKTLQTRSPPAQRVVKKAEGAWV